MIDWEPWIPQRPDPQSDWLKFRDGVFCLVLMVCSVLLVPVVFCVWWWEQFKSDRRKD